MKALKYIIFLLLILFIGSSTYVAVQPNSYDVSIEFYVVNTPTELVELTLFLERLR